MAFQSDVNKILKDMHSKKGQNYVKQKGSLGEKAVLKICEQFYIQQGGILIHSYSYRTDPTEPGNVKKDDNGKHYIENLGATTEIDVILVTPYRVFPIEVKSYKAKKITLTDDGIKGSYNTSKSPVHQNEMHCRHLYSFLYRAFDSGDTDFIVPIVCFVDETKIEDSRSDWQLDYIIATTLDGLVDVITEFNTPLDGQLKLNLQLVDNLLREAMTSNEAYYPVKY